jgi:hypothetical protein
MKRWVLIASDIHSPGGTILIPHALYLTIRLIHSQQHESNY